MGKYNRNLIVKGDRPITKIKLTEKMLSDAKNRAKKQPEKDYSGKGPQADLIGCLGEVVAEYWMEKREIPFKAKLKSRQHDYILTNSGKTIDVKTKDRNVEPQKNYDCSVPFYNHNYQKPDFFLFISLQTFNKYWEYGKQGIDKFKYAYVIGSIKYEEVSQIGIPYLTNEQDWTNGTVMWTGVLNVQMYQLISNELTIDLFKEKSEGANEQIDIQEVFVNPNVIKDMEKRFNKEIFSRPLPPWDKGKLDEFESIDVELQQSAIYHKLDRKFLEFRLQNLSINLEEKQLVNGKMKKKVLNIFREDFNRKTAMFVHANAAEDLLSRYKLFAQKDVEKFQRTFDSKRSSDELVNDILSSGYSQKDWLRLRKRG
jgi:hypothetical protein